MSLLSPIALLGLLTLLVPLILHFIKKSKVKELDWAAMEFLVKKDTQSMRRKSLKNLPLLFARLAILIFVVFALARPVGNLLNFGSKSPDSILILLDRSPEMGGSVSSGKTHLQVALEEVQSALQDFPESTRVYLIDSASLELTPVLSSEYLPLLSEAQPGDNPSSIPQMISKGLSELVRGEFGRTELWVVTSDLAESWNPQNVEWSALKTLVQQEAQIRPFVYKTKQEEDLSLTITKTAQEGEQVMLELQILGGASEQPVAIEGSWSDGTLIQEEIVIQDSQTRYELSLLTEKKSGAGTLALPADQNIANNEAYFSFGPLLDVQTAIITDRQESQLTGYLQRAAALTSRPHQKTRWISPQDVLLTDLSTFNLVIWAAGNESAEARAMLEDFVSAGGVAVVFPSPAGEADNSDWFFKDVVEAPLEEFFSIASWREKSGPWKNAISGEALPLKSLQGLLIASPAEEATPLATWSNGMPALSQHFLGEGRVFLLSTLPIPTWSNMENLALHLILIQRLLQEVEAQNGSGYQQVLSAGRAPYKAQLKSEGNREVAINRAPQSSSVRISKAEIRELLSAGNLEVASAGRPMRPWLYPFLLVALFFIIIEAALQVWPPRFSFTKKEVRNV